MKKFFCHTPLLFLLETFTACSFGNETSQTKNSDQLRPNILFIFANDQRADALGCAGNTYIETPNIDKLAKIGGWFSNTVRHGRSSSCYLHPKPDNTDEWEKLVSCVRQTGRSNHHGDAFCLKWL